MDLSIVSDPHDRAAFLGGVVVSLQLMACSLAGSLAVGIVGVWLQGARSRLVSGAVGVYIQAFRNTPPLIQLYFFYFGLGGVLRLPGTGEASLALLSNFGWAAISLSMTAGAFNIEIFRAGIEAVPRQMSESAQALGLTRWLRFRLVTLPLAFRICLPAFNNNLVNLIKATTNAYAIAVPELLYVSAAIWSDEFNVVQMMTVLLVVFIGIVSLVVWVLHRWERHMRIPGFSL
jgi:polar amino acid transport system permease protein